MVIISRIKSKSQEEKILQLKCCLTMMFESALLVLHYCPGTLLLFGTSCAKEFAFMCIFHRDWIIYLRL